MVLRLFTFIFNGDITVSMKKIVVILLVFFASLSLFSEEDKVVTSKEETVKFGPTASYFAPRNSAVKSIYGNGGAQFGFKIGVRVWKGLSVWLTADYYKADGKTTLAELQETTRLTQYPLSLGLRYNFFRRGLISPYLGGGYTYLYFKEESDIGNEEDKGQGYKVEGGVEFKLARHFSIDLNVTYFDVTVNPTGTDVQLGGVSAGLAFLINL